MGRGDIIKETTLEVFNTKDKEYWNAIPLVSKNHMEEEVTSEGVDMWQNFDRSIGHHFNLEASRVTAMFFALLITFSKDCSSDQTKRLPLGGALALSPNTKPKPPGVVF